MAKYIVLHDFTDLEDGDKVYRKDKPYPRPANKKVSKKRLDELSTSKNKIGVPLIKEVEEENEEQE
ncbi:hypothetical protein [Evansella clarkii]|uniref:hypothetical protein n=1 Tax=Evansella clarkii TaxID=79879 RepID=UPI000996C653|nr:hypothetical protein [Evansella clarkii]